jgi:hypothetical protein
MKVINTHQSVLPMEFWGVEFWDDVEIREFKEGFCILKIWDEMIKELKAFIKSFHNKTLTKDDDYWCYEEEIKEAIKIDWDNYDEKRDGAWFIELGDYVTHKITLECDRGPISFEPIIIYSEEVTIDNLDVLETHLRSILTICKMRGLIEDKGEPFSNAKGWSLNAIYDLQNSGEKLIEWEGYDNAPQKYDNAPQKYDNAKQEFIAEQIIPRLLKGETPEEAFQKQPVSIVGMVILWIKQWF